ncbi:hypothetical protein IEO21_05717 [Rhodonia placenta]|uniref:Uncharacterized protein n=1 Tax=Rhodonia placenta TaxID=104341 RepID=A0A8H7P1F4_9APHY|nr:hypothetical protein IEO21_05717 [Postia placenta]
MHSFTHLSLDTHEHRVQRNMERPRMQLTISVNAEPPAATVDSVIPPDTIQGLSFLRAARYGAGKGAWAVVTNATSTQGSERAVRLADEGFNVLAIGRDADLLASLLCRMKSAYDLEDNKRQAKTLVVDDATELSTEQWDALTAELKGLDIGVLALHGDAEVPKSKSATDVTEKAVGNTSAANVATLARLVGLVLPGMAQSGPALGTWSAFEPRPSHQDTGVQRVDSLGQHAHECCARGRFARIPVTDARQTARNVLSEKLSRGSDGPALKLEGDDDTAGPM